MKVDDAKNVASLIFEFEKELASAHMTKTAMRDPELTYNVGSIADCAANSPHINWLNYIRYCMGYNADEDVSEAVGKVNVSTLEALKKVSEVVASANIDTIKHYLRWGIINEFASHLSTDFINQDFDFFQTTLSGTKVLKPRWKRVMGMIENCGFGDALGQLYVDQHFTGDAKPVALRIVESVRDALRDRLNEVEWMSDSTRKSAMEKMDGFRVQIGFTDEVRKKLCLPKLYDNQRL